MKVLTQPRTHVRKQLKAFIAKVQGDKSLQDQLNAEDADVLSIANAAGFSISTEDLNAYRENLSDEELEGVAGGGFGSLNGGCPGFTVVSPPC